MTPGSDLLRLFMASSQDLSELSELQEKINQLDKDIDELALSGVLSGRQHLAAKQIEELENQKSLLEKQLNELKSLVPAGQSPKRPRALSQPHSLNSCKFGQQLSPPKCSSPESLVGADASNKSQPSTLLSVPADSLPLPRSRTPPPALEQRTTEVTSPHVAELRHQKHFLSAQDINFTRAEALPQLTHMPTEPSLFCTKGSSTPVIHASSFAEDQTAGYVDQRESNLNGPFEELRVVPSVRNSNPDHLDCISRELESPSALHAPAVTPRVNKHHALSPSAASKTRVVQSERRASDSYTADGVFSMLLFSFFVANTSCTITKVA